MVQLLQRRSAVIVTDHRETDAEGPWPSFVRRGSSYSCVRSIKFEQ